ncbi:UNVERIFIED_CONTAM: Aspartic proteinase CDR1 [Sesamum calycinum]|uniref:Aspartic proteinase CDR1 n=1 Tax=Sesamum calycinum TaxID=2727403 RepID=A0AAW2KV51_9LAMI
MAIYYEPLSIVLATLLLLLSSISLISLSEATKNCGVTLDLIHRESPLSPSYDPSITHFERLRNLFRRSISRHSALTSASFKSASKSPDSFEGTLTPIGGEYLIKISIGTPPVEILAIADTGSALTWTQCVPCTQCYKQKAPLFDPTKTTTYRSVSCTSQQCQSLGDESSSCDKSNGCLYQVRYGDSSYSNGDLAVETFTFDSSTSNESVVFPKVVFGCGHNNDGTFNETGSGIVGLGGGAVSIVRQLETTIGGKFSYCLTNLDSKSPSKISFGPNAIVIGPDVSSTPLVQKSPDTFYYLTLEGVSVGNEALAYNYIPNSNSKASVEEGNIIIDSGTTLTYLPSSLYKGLESTLEKSISGNRVSDPQGLFGLCYKLPSNGEFNAPPIIAHFTGADVELTQENTFLEVEKGVWGSCQPIAARPSDEVLILISNGDLAVETFAFDSSTSNESVVFPKVVFGCGHNNDGTFNETGSGIVGLGGGTVSIVRQLETTIGGKFSYCLPTLDSNSSSKISFGPNATVIGPKVLSTPIVQKSPDTFYYLTLEGVSVGNEALAYNYIPNFNSKASFEEGNIIIDSGTTLTFLPSSLYEGLESTLEKSISGNRVSDPQGLFGLCYELPSQWGI